jgi:hypothetical protein
MKRSVLMSALVLALASSLAVTACGGGGGSGEPAKDGDSAKKDGEESGSGDPVEEMQKISDGIQKDVDAVLQPIKDFDATLDSLTKLPADLKAAKSKADGKKILASLKVLLDGKEVDVVALKIDEAGGGIVKERIDKVKALVDNIKDVDNKVKDLVQKVTDAAPKIAAAAGKALPKLEAKLKAPFGVSADDKKKAEEDKKKITDIVDGFKTKAQEWQKLLTELPGKVKDFPVRLGKAFAGAK